MGRRCPWQVRGSARCLRTTLLAAAVLLALVLGAGCSRPTTEPGLFGRSRPPGQSAGVSSGPVGPQQPPSQPLPQPAISPDLPVAAEAVWTSADLFDVQLRVAVHAVRRIPGGTVLDWSLTPLRAPGLREGALLPRSLDLGLSRPGEDNPSVFLLDGDGRRLYRPLTRVGSRGGCVCTPLDRAQRQLRIGQTRLLQLTFPALPRDAFTIDVEVATVGVLARVPVTPTGLVPSVTTPTDLARLADEPALGRSTRQFPGPGGQPFVISVDRVVSGSAYTALHWTIQSVTGGFGLSDADQEPFASQPPGPAVNRVVASGPVLALAPARRLSVRWATLGSSLRDPVECLCTDLRGWTSALQAAQQQAGVVTVYPALPIGTQQVDVVLPGLATLTDVPVTAATDASTRSGPPTARRSRTWTYDATRPPDGWPADRWPTPVPDAHQWASGTGAASVLVS